MYVVDAENTRGDVDMSETDRFARHSGACVDGPYSGKNYAGEAGQTMFEIFQSQPLTLREFDDCVPDDTLVPPVSKLGEYRWQRDDYGRGLGGSWRWHPENQP